MLVQVTNHAGATAEYTSDGAVVDITAPVSQFIEARYEVEAGTIVADWDCVDTESGIAGYYHGVQLINAVTEMPYSVLSQNQTVSFGTDLVEGQMYLVSVKCQNGAGSVTYATAAVTVDSTPPVANAEYPIMLSVDYVYGQGVSDAEHQLAVVVSWVGLFSDQESGIAGYSIKSYLESSTDLTIHDVENFATEAHIPGNWEPGSVVCVTVEATNGAGSVTSDSGCTPILDTALTPGTVFDGQTPGADEDVVLDLHSAHASWTGFEGEGTSLACLIFLVSLYADSLWACCSV